MCGCQVSFPYRLSCNAFACVFTSIIAFPSHTQAYIQAHIHLSCTIHIPMHIIWHNHTYIHTYIHIHMHMYHTPTHTQTHTTLTHSHTPLSHTCTHTPQLQTPAEKEAFAKKLADVQKQVTEMEKESAMPQRRKPPVSQPSVVTCYVAWWPSGLSAGLQTQ